MNLTPAELAAHNNAVWCDTVCRAHGSAGAFDPDAWQHVRLSPPGYPNLVTLRADAEVAAVLGHLRRLRAELPERAWGVKDSFCTLDLTALGFDALFEASWIHLPPSASSATSTAGDLHWAEVTSADELARWEHGWAGGDVSGDAQRVFLPGLLADPEVCVMAAWQGSQRVGGAILNRSERGGTAVVGLSNVHTDDDPVPLYVSLAAAARARCPGLTVVGYEGGAWLAAAQASGFEVAGPLRVWLRRTPGLT